ncbi:MAG: hypothetical protein ABIQ35_05460, partial [Verrucomicrobiota bacterium]
MNHLGKLLLLPAALGLVLSVRGVTPDNRYNTIVDRNVFRLTSPPPPAAPPKVEDEALSRNIELSGISIVDGQKKAWFVIKPKAGSKDLPKYVNLSEEEEQDFLRVVNISEADGEVKVKNSGNEMTLSFKKNGTTPTLGVPAVGLPLVPPPRLGNTIAQPGGGSPIAGATGGLGSPAPTYGGRAVTVAGGPATGQMNSAAQADGLRSIPNRQLRTSPIA